MTKTCTDKQKIYAAYEYALSSVGKDMNAIPIYNKYVEFAEQAGTQIISIDKLRKIYHRAHLIPMEGLQEFHGKYRNWETDKSPHLAPQLLPEQERHFKATAAFYHTKKQYHRQLQWTLRPMQNGSFDSLHQ